MSETGDGLDQLRIPFEKIKFGKKLEVQGYGTMFEGEFDDRRVALKQLNITNLANIKPKLLAEILTISRFRQHPNLVALLGFCDERSNEMILVYEYIASGNLADKMRKRLTTIQRLEICLGAARGLDYLHTGVVPTTPGIVHGNIKLSKILLNSDSNSSKFEAKVSSFGLSKIVPGKAQKTLESTDEVRGKVTKESDVYSFGVLLLEVLCGVSELVDTDDYQERHVTELVPKKMEQNKLRKIVHFDIRKEIKTESLETYAKIACQCVMENPEARPTMARVVEELEKSLRLQGGEVTYVQIPGSRNIPGATDETVMEDDSEDDGSGVTVDSNILGNEPEDVKIPTIAEDVKDLVARDKLDVAREENSYEISIVGTKLESSNGEKNTEERAPHIPIVDSVDGESVPDRTHIEDTEIMSSNNDPETTLKILNDLNSNAESNTTVENKEDNQSKIHIEDAQKEMSIDDPEITKETLNDSNSNKKSNITEENKEDNKSTKITTNSESNSSDPSTSTNEEVQNSGILRSDSRNFNEDIEDELECLRIPVEKIKFGTKIDVHGYGSMFEGEFDHQHVALKRLNITNLGNIKPKLLSAILTVSRFRQHPNVVALIGFCDEKSNEIVIVYEYVSGGNLANKMSKHLTTIQRLEICLGAARGVEYLHTGIKAVDSEPGIIHGDIKLSKILLNSDSISSKFEAKVSGFGLPKLLPGQVQIDPKSMDASTGKLTKESDVYFFGVLLLEVLCGVPELVDTDDYQERHVTELVPKRMEQNMLRKIVHFDIRDEITTESLETYAKIACWCVLKNPGERPTMAEVVIELEKALSLQAGKVSHVEILGSSNGNGLSEGTIDQEKVDNDERISSNITEEESKEIEETIDDIATQGQSFPVPSLGSEDVEGVPDITHIEDAEKANGNNTSIEEITVDLKSNEESKIIGEDEVDNETKITTSTSESNIGDDSNGAMQDQTFPLPDERSEYEGATKEKGNVLMMSTNDPNSKEIMDDNITAMEITMEVQNSVILDSDNAKAGLLNTKKKPELIVNIREGDFSNFAPQESESKRSNSTCSESSNGDDTVPSDYLLQKSPANAKKTLNSSRNCCSCSWWSFISDRVVFYGGQFWNKLVSCFAWITGRCSRKKD